MRKPSSITGRLIIAVLGVELIGALCLLGAVSYHERRIQLKRFDANMQNAANTLYGAVDDTVDEHNNLVLDLRGQTLPRKGVYRVSDDAGHVLGAKGPIATVSDQPYGFHRQMISGVSFRFFSAKRDKLVDGPTKVPLRQLTILYGQPDAFIQHEVWEASRSFAVGAAFLLIGTTGILMLLIRKILSPIYDLATEAGKISVWHWEFEPPHGSKEIRELKPLVSALEQTISRLQKTFQQQKRFTRDAAHELKTDVAIVKSSFQLIEFQPQTLEEYAAGVALGLKDFLRLELTLQKMLTLSQLEQPAEADGAHSALNVALQNVLSQTAPSAELKNVIFDIKTFDPALIPLDIRDAEMLCANILFNAVQHSPVGGTVAVRLQANSDVALLEIRDQGAGILEGEEDLLFEPFHRGDPSRSRKNGGTGLGLSICKAICDRIEGKIDICNQPQGGAVVRVTLPLVEPLARQMPNSSPIC